MHGLNEGEKAKIIYLCHHLGSPHDAMFINDTMPESTAKTVFEPQVGAAKAKEMADYADGNYLKAHREWLSKFVNQKINTRKFMCDPSAADNVRDLITITKSIRREVK